MKARTLAWLVLVVLWAAASQAAVVSGVPVSSAGVNLGTAQTGNADSTNTLDRGYTLPGAVLLKVTTTIGATPTVTLNIVGSMDGTNFYNVAYAVAATPETPVVAAITITTATTNYYILRPGHPWRFLKIVATANTNVTLTYDVFPGW
jgi:hypothetical protein